MSSTTTSNKRRHHHHHSSRLKADYIETESGNRISKHANILDARSIIIKRNTFIDHNVTLRGDLRRPADKTPSSPSKSGRHGSSSSSHTAIAIGRYCILERDVTIAPPGREPTTATESHTCVETGLVHLPIKIGSYVHIGVGTTVEAVAVGSHVFIGRNCTVGRFSIIKECVYVEDNTVIPDYQVIPPFSRVRGSPAQVVEELPESYEQILELHARSMYSGINDGLY
jgi:dynactin-5